jgi:hypothetical protein
MRREDATQCGDDDDPHPRPRAISGNDALLIDLKLDADIRLRCESIPKIGREPIARPP